MSLEDSKLKLSKKHKKAISKFNPLIKMAREMDLSQINMEEIRGYLTDIEFGLDKLRGINKTYSELLEKVEADYKNSNFSSTTNFIDKLVKKIYEKRIGEIKTFKIVFDSAIQELENQQNRYAQAINRR